MRVSNVLLRYDDSSHGAVPYSITLRIRSLHLQDLRLETLTLTLALALTQTLALALTLTLTLTLTRSACPPWSASTAAAQ